jgi:hypothetical protein
MKIGRNVVACFLLLLACAYGQTMIVTAVPKDPEVKTEQRTAAILHYEKMRGNAREIILQLALDLQSADGSSKAKLNEAINYQQDMVGWANWCILALRDKTGEAKNCIVRTDLK